MDLTPENFRNWAPLRIYENGGRFFVDWIFLGDKRFTEPFFEDTLHILMRKPFNLVFRHQTPIEFLGEIYNRSPGLKPRGLIFHVSRCGSTLVAQMFASLEKNVVISESSVVDKIVRANVSTREKIDWLRWTVNALAQKRSGREENLIIKLDSWGILDLQLIKSAFPETPWIFMYRDPVEVIVSNLQQPGAQMIPGAVEKIFPGMSLDEILQYSTEERFARTIAAFSRAALEHKNEKLGKFINYDQLPGAVLNDISDHFGLEFSDDEKSQMKRTSKYNAKSPNEKFSPDSEKKKKAAGEDLVQIVENLVSPLYQELENERLANK